ncbi:aminotransferase class V-fold PLP-dependent enzyme [Microbacterium koreense]|uniref:Aminotransferase class V-fold PLP-dependent enzyme n=1 Tax=Microbacterium koreense TaxID=323761 RepID=A0ABW2ZS06_9MICO
MPTTLSASAARSVFDGGRGYLAACTAGIPPRSARDAVVEDVRRAAGGDIDVSRYCEAVERSRGLFAQLVGIGAERVAVGSQVSVLTSLVATAIPAGGEVLVPEGEFSSLVRPFLHTGRDLRVREVPLEALADAIGPDTGLVAFSLVQSATGEVADVAAIAAAARSHGVLTYGDATQAVGWLPVDATAVDALVCHAYKWLCAPRGAAFLALSPEFQRRITPLHAGWYAGDDPWASCYGAAFDLAPDARRLDVSPAWQAFVGAAAALEVFAAIDTQDLYVHTTGLAARFRAAMGLDEPVLPSAIVTWPDPDGRDLAALSRAGLTASGRAGRARVAFHVFNDDADVDLVLGALGRQTSAARPVVV